jgi:glutamate-1-semialdehyde 2,1-aminomutase
VNADLVARATRVMPGGVSSPVRAFLGVGGEPRVVRAARGAMLTDVDGNAYVDLQMAFGPLLVGHAHPAVAAAVADAATRGLAYGATCVPEVELAEAIVRHHPAMAWARFVSSGTEATMSAVRLARAATGRELIVKFSGCYHGHADLFLSEAGSGLATLGIPASPGVPAATSAGTLTLPLDDEAALEEAFLRHGERIAAVIVEGVPANHGLLPQRRAWRDALRRLTRANGALLVVDEVITGFRLAWGGATASLGLDPDLVTLGKVIGGGMPVGAYGGRADLKRLVAPEGPVYQAGTLSGNPVAMAAGLATLDALAREPSAHAYLERATRDLAQGVSEAAAKADVPVAVRHVGSLLWMVLDDAPLGLRAAPLSSKAVARFGRLHGALLRHGVYLPPSPYEVCFLSTAHAPDVVERAVAAFAAAFKEVGP